MSRYHRLYWTFRLYQWFHRYKHQYTQSVGPRCFIFLAADYGNLGDVAITFAQKEFLGKMLPQYNVVEVPAVKTLLAIKEIRNSVNPSDVITVVGGGNMGDLYGDIELLRLMVVESFPNNKIILFPQTIDYSKSPEATWLLKCSRKVYKNHPNLIMMARERISYGTMKELYPTVDVRLTPDIVMTLDKRLPAIERESIATFCLRKDKEKCDNDKLVRKILNNLDSHNLKIEYYDTHIGGDRYSEVAKYSELEKIWSQFRRSKIVVTDRLHGMIFAFITCTPAIVLKNSNFKVKECYRWIQDCGYVKFVDREVDVPLIDDLLHYAGNNFNHVRENIISIFDKTL